MDSSWFFLYMSIHLFQCQLLKSLFFLHWIVFATLSENSCSNVYMCVCVCFGYVAYTNTIICYTFLCPEIFINSLFNILFVDAWQF